MNERENYEDIMNEPWPQKAKVFRPHMRLVDRAKIFLPFAALKGFEEEVKKRKDEEIEKMNFRQGKIKFADGEFYSEK